MGTFRIHRSTIGPSSPGIPPARASSQEALSPSDRRALLLRAGIRPDLSAPKLPGSVVAAREAEGKTGSPPSPRPRPARQNGWRPERGRAEVAKAEREKAALAEELEIARLSASIRAAFAGASEGEQAEAERAA